MAVTPPPTFPDDSDGDPVRDGRTDAESGELERRRMSRSAHRAASSARGEPLAASWTPKLDAVESPGARRRRHRRARRSYRLGLLAVPFMLLVSGMAVYQAIEPAGVEGPFGHGRPPPADAGSGEQREPVVTEDPNQSYAPDIFSAELPPGGDFPISGGRTFNVLPGSSDKVGSGSLYSYTVEVEVDVKLDEGNATFGDLVQKTLADPRSWTNPHADGAALQRVDGDAEPDFRVTLISRDTAREVCGYSEGLPYETSCRKGDRVYLNASRWVRGAVAFEGDIGTYRRYMINHEVGHALGNDHVPCDEQGGLAPVMMQQTFSTANNELHKLNERVSQGGQIPADGLECKYNAWPFPAASKGNSPG